MDIFESAAQKHYIRSVLNDWKLTPATFAHKITGGQWIPAKHLMYISARIAAGIAKGGARIIISAPPRHGKSELSSVHMPSWLLERYPKKRVILVGYGADLSVGFSRRVRDTFLDPQNAALLTTKIRRDASRVDAFLTNQGGGLYAVGLGGVITGRGADVLIIDDYIKEIKEALSQAQRDYIWNWFVTTAYTRLEPGASVIIIATRWHSDDLIGRLLRDQRENWEYIEIPAIAMPDDILGREVGEALFPERYNLETLQEQRTMLGSIFFDALYQQRPVDESKKLTDSNWIKIIDDLDYHEYDQLKIARVWDLAATQDGGDYLAGTLCGYNPNTGNFYLMNCIRDQLSPGRVEEKVKETALADGLNVRVRIEQEPGSAGKSLVHHYKTNILNDFDCDGIPVVTAKLVRAQPLLAAAEAGKVFMIKGSWNQAWLDEFDSFPGGEFDDQVDTGAAGYVHLSGKKPFSASWGRSRRSSTSNSAATKKAQIVMARASRSARPSATFGRRKYL